MKGAYAPVVPAAATSRARGLFSLGIGGDQGLLLATGILIHLCVPHNDGAWRWRWHHGRLEGEDDGEGTVDCSAVKGDLPCRAALF